MILIFYLIGVCVGANFAVNSDFSWPLMIIDFVIAVSAQIIFRSTPK